MESETEKKVIPPDPPDPEVEKIRKVIMDTIGDLDARINLEVEEQLKEMREELQERDARIIQLEKEIKILLEKQPSFSRVLEIRNRMETRKTEQVRPNLTTTTFPSVAATAAVFSGPSSSASSSTVSSPAPTSSQPRRPSTNTRRPSTGPQPPKQVVQATEKEIRDQFRSSKSKICCKPVTMKHIVCMYQQITSDVENYTADEIFHGEKHAQARLECANQFMELELNFLPGQFEVVKADYNRDLNKQTLIVTLASPDQVRKCFFKQSKLLNRKVEIQTHFPPVTLQRRRTLFTWIQEARKKFTEKNFQLRLGDRDLEVFEKERGGIYYPLPLAAFAEDLGKDFETLPGLFKERETAIGRPATTEPRKNDNSSPVHQEQRESKSTKTDEGSDVEESSGDTNETIRVVIHSDTPVRSNDGESQANREKSNSNANQDGAC